MAIQISISNAIGSRGRGNIVPPFDPDAQAFITAASITDPTQQSAINTLVTDLKGYNIWTKFKAIYPIVGGTAASHKWNLKDPRDLDAAFRLTFASGWTHSSNGMTPLNAFANTFLAPFPNLSLNSTHISYYSRTNVAEGVYDIGATTLGNDYLVLNGRNPSNNFRVLVNDGAIGDFANSDSRGLLVANRTGASVRNSFVNGIKKLNDTSVSGLRSSNNIYLGALNNGGSAALYSTKQCAFASIGDGLTDTEAANFYTAVQAFQVTLGRSIGTQTVSDADAQAFVNAANITDQVEANAINNLVIGMKADGLWTKMKAIYPVVGGVASSHAVNLKTPGTFNLTFSSGWTHSSNGMQPNGTSAYADTNLPISFHMTASNAAFGIYSRTNDTTGLKVIGGYDGANVSRMWINLTNGNIQIADTGQISYTAAPSTGFFMSRRDATNFNQSYKNGVSLGSITNNFSVFNRNFYLGATNNMGTPDYYSTHQLAFAFLGGNSALTDTDATNLYNRVNTFQTTLNRNV